jgi:diadenosine tetraphosphate (Ap4A) HIT family hydrolase
MLDFSERKIREDCPHCDPNSFALKHPLEETKHFWVVCDVHPLVEGHILIIPKYHLSCVGEYDEGLFREFVELYQRFSNFIKTEYGSISTFEHGKVGQTVFHSHVHLLPFKGKPEEIVPEGKEKLIKIKNFGDLRTAYEKDGQYLFFSIQDKLWLVDLLLGKPKFFRVRFAKALASPERGNWKKMHFNKQIMAKANKEIKRLEGRWGVFKA